MKIPFVASNRARGVSHGVLTLALLSQASSLVLRAAETVAPPLLEFASGLPGKQVRLSWVGQAGVRYAVEKSTALGTDGGGWTQVALVEATGPDFVWLDPVATTTKAFYRVSQPQAEVFSISFPVLTTVGGELRIQGQCIPPGSFLVLQIPGQAPILVPLSSLGNGEWLALVSGTFGVGAEVSAVRIQSGTGVTLVTLNQPLEITTTGRASDSPGSLPPAPPISEGRRLPVHNLGSSGNDGVEIQKLVASNIGSSGQDGVEVKWRSVANNIGSSGQDGVDVPLWQSKKGYDYYQAQSQLNSSPLLAIWAGRKGYDYYQAQSALNSASIVGAWLGRRGYQYYMAKSDLNAAGLHSNPAFQSNGHAGEMPTRSSSKLVKEIAYALYKHPNLMKREMGPDAISPAPSGLPGEVSFQFCALSLATPAGPPLELVHTYRSKPPVRANSVKRAPR